MKLGKLLIGLFSIALAGQASAAVMEVGYCNGEVSSQAVSKVGNCDVSAAIVLSSEMLKRYEGADITGVKVYLATADNLVDLTAWIRTDLSGDNLAAATAAPIVGWQTLSFESPVKVSDISLAVGYTVNQTKSSKCIALGGDVCTTGHYIAKRGEWEEVKNPQGSICVELVVEGEMVPAADLEVVSMSFENPVVKVGENLVLNARVRNSSLSEIDGFSYSVINTAVNGGWNLLEDKYTAKLAPKQSVELSLSVPADDFPVDWTIPIMFCVDDEIGILDNNIAEGKAGVYAESFPRKLLLEEFTTEECPNCPRAITSIATALESGYADKMVVVAHHVGFYTDWLTIPEESELLWFYGDDGSFAPAAMYDRTVRNSSLNTPVESVGFYDTFGPRLDEAVDKPGFVKLETTAVETEDGINVNVTAEAHSLFEILANNPHITVLLIEDGIVHHHQAGIANPEFTHSHVSRAYLSSVMGDPIEFDESGKLHWEASVDKNSEWNLANMEAVAFVHDYNPSDRTSCQVFNVAVSPISPSAVEGIESENMERKSEYYDLQGRSLDASAKGMMIKRSVSYDGSVRIEKIIRK